MFLCFIVKVRYTPILNSHGPDPNDLNEPYESVFTKIANDSTREYVETGSMPCPERGMRVTGFEDTWEKDNFLPAPEPIENIAWILQSQDFKERTFIGKVGGCYLALQKNEEGEKFGVRFGTWNTSSEEWRVEFAHGNVRNTPFDSQTAYTGARKRTREGNVRNPTSQPPRHTGAWKKEETWAKWQLVEGAGTNYYVKAHESFDCDDAGAFCLF
jgi:hypothetical protein